MIDWLAFVIVLVSALAGASIVVAAFSFGIRLLTLSGRTPIVTPAEFTDAITIMTPSEIAQAEKRAAKAARKSPLTEGQKKAAFVGACAFFTLSALAVLFGIYLIVPALHALG
ncbi:peptidase [Agromyces atrinae]|uniref:Peptidase n=1 Tax=Agromyces atrinae TaxID=592376 RepID=A0A4Q2M847_9MICO|nr:peptidase [Agromyces atrinae]MCI2958974.1 peptidase [Agromyces atrinae]NYD65799.1 hypothetical protein [Agromyces atrinae]RXZ86151.1 peptidase [Agromyces atrinae]